MQTLLLFDDTYVDVCRHKITFSHEEGKQTQEKLLGIASLFWKRGVGTHINNYWRADSQECCCAHASYLNILDHHSICQVMNRWGNHHQQSVNSSLPWGNIWLLPCHKKSSSSTLLLRLPPCILQSIDSILRYGLDTPQMNYIKAFQPSLSPS